MIPFYRTQSVYFNTGNLGRDYSHIKDELEADYNDIEFEEHIEAPDTDFTSNLLQLNATTSEARDRIRVFLYDIGTRLEDEYMHVYIDDKIDFVYIRDQK